MSWQLCALFWFNSDSCVASTSFISSGLPAAAAAAVVHRLLPPAMRPTVQPHQWMQRPYLALVLLAPFACLRGQA